MRARKNFSTSNDRWSKRVINFGRDSTQPVTPDVQLFGKEAVLEEIRTDIRTITDWSIGAFGINGLKVEGPIILTKTLALKWNLNNPKPTVRDLTIEDFEFFTIMNPIVDLIILGTGRRIEYPDKELTKKLRDIAPLEVQDSANAAATFNLLITEPRTVVVALLPIW